MLEAIVYMSLEEPIVESRQLNLGKSDGIGPRCVVMLRRHAN